MQTLKICFKSLFKNFYVICLYQFNFLHFVSYSAAWPIYYEMLQLTVTPTTFTFFFPATSLGVDLDAWCCVNFKMCGAVRDSSELRSTHRAHLKTVFSK